MQALHGANEESSAPSNKAILQANSAVEAQVASNAVADVDDWTIHQEKLALMKKENDGINESSVDLQLGSQVEKDSSSEITRATLKVQSETKDVTDTNMVGKSQESNCVFHNEQEHHPQPQRRKSSRNQPCPMTLPHRVTQQHLL